MSWWQELRLGLRLETRRREGAAAAGSTLIKALLAGLRGGAREGAAGGSTLVKALLAGLRGGAREGAAAGGSTLVVALLAVLPGRWVLSAVAAGEGRDRVAALMAGWLADGALLVLPCTLLAALCLLVDKRRRRIGRGMLVLLALGAWNAMVSMTESSLSRGVFPGWVDVAIMGRSPAMMEGSLQMFLLPRNLLPALLVLPLVGLVIWRGWPQPRVGAQLPRLLGALGAGAALLLVARLVFMASVGLGAVPGSPLGLLSAEQLPELVACLRGPCEPAVVLELDDDCAASDDIAGSDSASCGSASNGSTHSGLASSGLASSGLASNGPTRSGSANNGAAMLGWPPPQDSSLNQPPHPFRRAFPSREIAQRQERSHPQSSNGSRDRYARPLLAELATLSEALFHNDEEPIHIWQIALEGVRADDVHALNPAAPRALTPFLTSLYEQAATRTSGVLASRRTWTAGVRTPHGVSALLCGLGTLPHGLALSRDLPAAELRCLPDVLADAGLASGYGYGGSPAFDRMGDFLAAHQLAPVIDAQAMAPDTPRVAWGLTDRVVFDAMAATLPARSSYTFVLSLSHHHPFVVPDDMPAAVRARAEGAFAAAAPDADEADRRRLLTLAYTDAALQEWFAKLDRNRLLDRSIIAISADHAIPERALWRHRPGALAAHQTRALIPFVLRLPPALLANAHDPEQARARWSQIAERLDHTQLSQNDIPTLLLALLEQLPQLRRLDRSKRWHSMGGQVSSPFYRAPGPAPSRLHGIHAATALYFLDAHGRPCAPDEPATLVVSPQLARAITPSLRPARAALRHLRGFRGR